MAEIRLRVEVVDGDEPMLSRVATASRLAELLGADSGRDDEGGTGDRLEFGDSSTVLEVSYSGVEVLEEVLGDGAGHAD